LPGTKEGFKVSKQTKSVRRLIRLGICRPSDIASARNEAETLSSPEYSRRIRQAERLFGAVGEPNRIKILLLLSKREMCVCELESALGLPQPTISHHLSLLEKTDLVQRYKRERWVFYKLLDSPVTDLLRGLV
jgi:DNA-binding transcriptional ArsR family regulator